MFYDHTKNLHFFGRFDFQRISRKRVSYWFVGPCKSGKKTAFANATVKSLFLFGIHHNLFSPFEGDGIWRPALTEFQVFVPYHLEAFLDSWTMIFLFLSHRSLMVTFCERDKAYNLGYFKAREGSPYHLLCQKDS